MNHCDNIVKASQLTNEIENVTVCFCWSYFMTLWVCDIVTFRDKIIAKYFHCFNVKNVKILSDFRKDQDLNIVVFFCLFAEFCVKLL